MPDIRYNKSLLLTRNPLVSIIIPCYNYGHFLSDAIESVLNQTYSNIEILVVDDGSCDHTAEVADKYSNSLRYLYKDNGGLSHARNYGVQRCSGEYVVFLDADNKLENTFVEECMNVMAANPQTAFIYTQLYHFGSLHFSTKHPHYDLDKLKVSNYIDACSLLRTHLVRKYPYDESNRISWEDWDFYLTLAEHGYYGMLLNKPLVQYRRHDTNMTSTLDSLKKQRLRVSIMRKHIRLVGLKLYSYQHYRLLRMQIGVELRNLKNRKSIGWIF